MKLSFVRFTFTLAVVSLGGVLQSCQSDTQGASNITTGTETNWLKSCSRDLECDTLSCECGVCTQRCTQEDTCQLPDAVCSPASGEALGALCPGQPTVALCLPACRETCIQGRVCVDGACIPTVDAASSANSSEAVLTESTSELGTDASLESFGTSMNAPSSRDSGATSDVGASTNLVDASADTGAVGVDAGSSCPLDTRPLTEGCCYDDNDCEDGQGCYQAACSGDVMAPGRCASPPAAPNCYAERDCDSGQVCQGGLLAACGTLGPDSLGTCVTDCEFDSCHPDRCDELGEPCCDPLPGDGPNYCNAGLACAGDACVQPDDPTPELARQNCEGTGGTWQETSCGDYFCGQPPACAAVIPGCDCGVAKNFTSTGCADDPECSAP